MKFSYDFLQSFFKEKLPTPDDLADLLMMHFFEVEEVSKEGKDFVIDIDILSSRAGDCLSHLGVAREIAAITGKKLHYPASKPKEGKSRIEEDIGIDIRNACSRYLLSGVEGIKIKKSPEYIQRRLKTCGLKPINNVVDVVNYVMLETGQPLHAFDAEKIEGNKITVRFAKKREKIVTLDEKRLELNENILVIADQQSSVGVAGIKGGIVPEVDKDTKKIYLEAANFDSKVIRRGSRDIGIRTDASLRFEYGVPCQFAEIATERALSLLAEIAGGKVMKGRLDYYPKKEEERSISFEAKEVRDILGAEIPLERMEKILRSLGFKTRRDNSSFLVEVPFFRKDIERKEDIVEEIGRIYGYENIEATCPEEPVVVSHSKEKDDIEDACRELWRGLGFSESYNYSFINNDDAEFYSKQNLLEVEKPVSLEFKYLRPSLLPGLLKNLAKNEKNFQEIRMFEIGKVFSKKREGETSEKKRFSAISSGDDFYQMKGKVNAFLEKLFEGSISYSPEDKEGIFKKGYSANILLKGEKVGTIGEVSEKAKNKMRVKSGGVLVDLDFEKLTQLYKERKIYEPIPKFPSLIRDLSVLVPKETDYIQVEEKIRKSGGKTLKNLTLFDLYEGDEIGKDKKSFAFRMHFQDKGKTLSAETVNNLQEKIIKALDDVSGWKVRKK